MVTAKWAEGDSFTNPLIPISPEINSESFPGNTNHRSVSNYFFNMFFDYSGDLSEFISEGFYLSRCTNVISHKSTLGKKI